MKERVTDWEECCYRCGGAGDTWEPDLAGEFDRCPCGDCNGTGRVPMTEDGAKEWGIE